MARCADIVRVRRGEPRFAKPSWVAGEARFGLFDQASEKIEYSEMTVRISCSSELTNNFGFKHF